MDKMYIIRYVSDHRPGAGWSYYQYPDVEQESTQFTPNMIEAKTFDTWSEAEVIVEILSTLGWPKELEIYSIPRKEYFKAKLIGT